MANQCQWCMSPLGSIVITITLSVFLKNIYQFKRLWKNQQIEIPFLMSSPALLPVFLSDKNTTCKVQ